MNEWGRGRGSRTLQAAGLNRARAAHRRRKRNSRTREPPPASDRSNSDLRQAFVKACPLITARCCFYLGFRLKPPAPAPPAKLVLNPLYWRLPG